MTLITLYACAAPSPDAEVPPVVSPVGPDLVVEQPLAVLGSTEFGEETAATFTLQNVGDALLVLDPAVLDDPSGQFRVIEPISPNLLPGASTTLDVVFGAALAGDAEAQVSIASNDPHEQVVSLTVRARTLAPVLSLETTALDFGEWGATCAVPRTIGLTNLGTSALRVRTLEVRGAGFSLAAPSLTSLPLPWNLAPGARRDVTVYFEPTRATAYAASLVIDTNDPLQGEVAVALDGSGLENPIIEDSWTAQGAPVDIVFAVGGDDADGVSARLAAALPSLTAPLTDIHLAWQVGAIRSDDGCLQNGLLPDGTMTEDEQIAAFSALLDTAGTAHTLSLFERALGEAWAEGCNVDLVRRLGNVVLIGVSDTADPAPEASGYYSAIFDRITSDAGDSAAFFLGPDGGDCGPVDLAWTDVTAATGGQYLSICDDLPAALAGIAGAAIERQDAFPVSRVPVVDTLVAWIDDTRRTDWIYSPAENVVRFADAPTIGSDVRVMYDAAPICE